MRFPLLSKTLRLSALAIGLGAGSAMAIDANSRARVDIESSALGKALIELAEQLDVSIVFEQSPVLSQPVPAIKGEQKVADIFRHLLMDAGLRPVYVSERVISVVQDVSEVSSTEQDYRRKWFVAPWHEELTVNGQRLTGSRLKRNDNVGSVPIDILSDFDIELAGAQSVGDLLRTLPSVVGNSASTSVNNGGNGTATVTLRGLPSSNTLLLINGRRVANAGLSGDSVDLNSLSLAAVERIEVLKGGASAVYGSDAIAGVINIITKKDVDGVQVDSYQGRSRYNDLETRNTNVIVGKMFERAQFVLSASLYDQAPIFSRERRISASADTSALGGFDQRSSATPNVRVDFPDGDVILGEDGQGGFLPGTSIDDFRPLNETDGFNYLAHTSAIVPASRKAVNSTFQMDLADNLGTYIDLAYTETKSRNRLAPVPLFLAFESQPYAVDAEQFYNPFGETLYDVRKRLVEFGDRIQDNATRSRRFAWGFEGGTDRVSWELEYHWSQTDASEAYSNILNGERLQLALSSPEFCAEECVALNLFGPPGSIDASQVDYLRHTLAFAGFSKLYGTSGNVNFSWGEADVAIGLDWRKEQMAFAPRDLGITPVGAPDRGPSAGERTIAEAYWEASIPLVKGFTAIHSLDLELATRMSHYSDFGETTNPHIALKYRPIEPLLIRAAYSEGFRAPSLIELFESGVESQAFLTDPCADPQRYQSLPGCTGLADATRIQFLTVSGGNADLEPERSKNITLGMVFASKRWPAFTAAVDYYRIQQRNVVDANAQYILDQNAEVGSFADRVVRDENGDILSIAANKINIGTRRVRGWDLNANYAFPKTRKGRLYLSLNASNINRYSEQQSPVSRSVNLAGTFADEASEGRGALPKWKLNVGAYWKYKRWQASYTTHYISKLVEQVPFSVEKRTISSWLTHDIQASYVFFWGEGARITLGVNNVFDKEPPLSAAAFNDNIDARTHDLIGRFGYLKLALQF
jgi:iron complex outermembrane receptor protein